MSTHNLCFGEKIRKVGIPLHKIGLMGYTFHLHVFLMKGLFMCASTGSGFGYGKTGKILWYIL